MPTAGLFPEPGNHMNHHYRSLILVLAGSGLLWMLVACTPATSGDPDVSDAPPDAGTTAAASTSTPEKDQDDTQPTNIIERFWSPFDNAVDDINRDLNKGDPDPPESDE